jgi:hypothetical protein
MKKQTIRFLTRYYTPLTWGGVFIRESQVKQLEKDYNVQVVTVSYKGSTIKKKWNIHYIPFSKNVFGKYNKYITLLLEKFWIVEDYLDERTKCTYSYLQVKVKEWDVVFATTGGELWCIKLWSILKKNKQVQFIVNYHDLLLYWFYDWHRLWSSFHVKIDKSEYNYLSNVDKVITTSSVMTNTLVRKFPFLTWKVSYMYFWYRQDAPIPAYQIIEDDKIRISYIGSMWKLQSPEVIIDVLEELPDSIRKKISVTFIWNYQLNQVIKNSNLVHKIPYMKRAELLPYVMKNTDLAYFSLINIPWLRYAMPTKLYEYIWLGLPILWVLPEWSEALNLIRREKIWLSCIHSDKIELKKILVSLVENKEQIQIYAKNLKDLREWFKMDTTLKKMKRIIET